jgi:hypothetical protein
MSSRGWCPGDRATVRAMLSSSARFDERDKASVCTAQDDAGFPGIASEGSIPRTIIYWFSGPDWLAGAARG